MSHKKPLQSQAKEYLGHFFKFLGTFIVIIGISLFLFSFTAGA